MNFVVQRSKYLFSLVFAFFFLTSSSYADGMRFIQVAAKTKEERSQIVNLGMSIEAVVTDSVWGFANQNAIQKLKAQGYILLGNYDFEVARGGHQGAFGFPPGDAAFHTYDQLTNALKQLQKQNPDISSVEEIGKSIENRSLWAFHINTSTEALKTGISSKPGVIFMGNHHAREHVSVEMPLRLAEYLISHRQDPKISQLLESRDIWIIPMVNPDGAEYDIATGRYRWWRKNRRDNKDGTFGVDLNRNYGYAWGTGGSDTDTSSDIYMGTKAFSEPETQSIRDFVKRHLNTKILLSFHTFSELILYPWGNTYDPVEKAEDRAVYEKMAKTMAAWNHYTPEQSSELYIASGDTTDWSYGELGIFSFTFELSPNSMMGGGFYPGAKILDKVFNSNIQPCLYLIHMAGDPYQVLDHHPSTGLKNYVDPRVPEAALWQMSPL